MVLVPVCIFAVPNLSVIKWINVSYIGYQSIFNVELIGSKLEFFPAYPEYGLWFMDSENFPLNFCGLEIWGIVIS